MGRKPVTLAIWSEDAGRRSSTSGAKIWKACAAIALMFVPGACNPIVRLDTAVKPIAISLYVKIDQEVRVRVDRDIEDSELNDLLALSTGSIISTDGAQIATPPAAEKHDAKPRPVPGDQ